jgi:hypothetical protein
MMIVGLARHLVSKVIVCHFLALLSCTIAAAEDVAISISVAPKDIGKRNTPELNNLFRSLRLPAFESATTGGKIKHYGYRISENAIIPYGAEFEFERVTGHPVALPGHSRCLTDIRCDAPSSPAIQVGIRNKSPGPLAVARVIVQVKSSKPNAAPRFGVSFDDKKSSGSITLTNESRSDVASATLRYDVKCSSPDVASVKIEDAARTYPFAIDAKVEPPFDPNSTTVRDPVATSEANPLDESPNGVVSGGSIEFTFWRDLAKVVPDIAKLMRRYFDAEKSPAPNDPDGLVDMDELEKVAKDTARRIKVLYERGCKPYLAGVLTGTYVDPSGKTLPFSSVVVTKLNVYPPEYEMIKTTSIVFSSTSPEAPLPRRANLRSEGSDYQIVVEVGRTVPPGQQISVPIDLIASETSDHELSFQAVTDKGPVASPQYLTRVFVPWTAVLAGQRQK